MKHDISTPGGNTLIDDKSAILEEALGEIRREYPDFEDSSHPDFHVWSEGFGPVPPALILPVDRLSDLIDSDMPRVFELFSSSQDADIGSDFWQNATHSLKMLAVGDQGAALKLLTALIDDRSHTVEINKKFLVVQAILEAFGDTALNSGQFQKLHEQLRALPDVLALPELQTVFKLWADTLTQQVTAAGESSDDSESSDDGYLDLLRASAADLWALITANPAAPTITTTISPPTWNPLMDAINHAVGVITEFQVQSIIVEHSRKGDEWTGLPQMMRSQLEDMLNAPREISRLVEVIVITKLQLLNHMDPAWTQKHVLTLLDFGPEPTSPGHPDNRPQGSAPHDTLRDSAPHNRPQGSAPHDTLRDSTPWRCWSAYLTWGRTSNEILEAGLDRMYLEVARRVWKTRYDHTPESHPLDRPLKKSLRSHLVAVCVYSDQLIRESRWILELTSALSEENRTLFIRALGEALRELDAKAADEVWNGWLKWYWQQRLQGIPDRMDALEAGAFAGLTVELPEHAAEAIPMSCAQPASLLPHSRLLSDLSESAIIEELPDETAGLLLHLCENTDTETADLNDMSSGFWLTGYKLEELVRRLHDRADSELLKGIINKAMELGSPDARSWFPSPA